jgi:hypothetical protein
MQIPKPELIYSYPLNKLFIKEFKHSDKANLQNQCKDFEDIYVKSISNDLRLIQAFTGFDWNAPCISIYIVKNCPSSISHPLILRYQNNPAFMYTLLLHELVHNNLEGNIGILEHDQEEVYVNAVVRAVINQSRNARAMLKAASLERSWMKMLKSRISLTENKPLKAILLEKTQKEK